MSTSRASSAKPKPKPTTKKASAQKTAPKTAKTQSKDTDAVMRKKELVDAVVARSGIKQRDAKPVIEAVLAELGETLARGREMSLPPLGRVKINREKQIDNGRVIVVKLRQKDNMKRSLPKTTAAE